MASFVNYTFFYLLIKKLYPCAREQGCALLLNLDGLIPLDKNNIFHLINQNLFLQIRLCQLTNRNVIR